MIIANVGGADNVGVSQPVRDELVVVEGIGIVEGRGEFADLLAPYLIAGRRWIGSPDNGCVEQSDLHDPRLANHSEYI
jgi:hypothetical protein